MIAKKAIALEQKLAIFKKIARVGYMVTVIKELIMQQLNAQNEFKNKLGWVRKIMH